MNALAATYDPAAKRAAIKADNIRRALADEAEKAERIAACAAPRAAIAPSTLVDRARVYAELANAAEKYGSRF